MEYERDYTFANMYLGNEIRFDGIARLAHSIVTALTHKPAVNALTAKA